MSDRHRRVKELFLEARSLPPDEREAWLQEACDVESMRADVASLLAAEVGMPGDYLAPPPGPNLSPGTVLGRYQVVKHLGSGGMGDVWLAHDGTLGRRVAIKVPAEHLIRDPTGRGVRREARAAASLDHPAVCRVFELGETENRPFIVMEYVQGETLAARLRRGRVPLHRALTWATAVAGAVEQAHDQDLAHGDLKPANVMLSRSDQVKVMDFGLARSTSTVRGSADSGDETSGAGASWMAGTPAYMAPERLMGEPADGPSDIWAFGCVLYELLTGQPAFDGDTVPETIAAILERDADWRTLPRETPPEIRRLLRRCLRKDPGDRLRHIGDARLILEEVTRDEPVPGPPTPSAPAQPWWRRPGIGVGGAVLLAAGVLLAGWLDLQPAAAPPGEALHATISLPPGVRVVRAGAIPSSVAVSPDGRTLALAATDQDGRRLYVRRLAHPEAVPLQGTDNALGPFFSPEGDWIGYFADGRLRRVPLGGGASVDIAAAPGVPLGASWGSDNRIVFSSGSRSALHIVPAGGGEPAPLIALDTAAGEVSQRHPELLADGRTLLFTSFISARWFVHALDLRTGHRAELASGATPRHLPSGHVVMNRGTDLFAARFDPARLEFTAPVVPVLQGLAAEVGMTMHYGLSRGGTLAFVVAPAEHALTLIEDGIERIVGERPWGPYARPPRPRFSPDGTRLAFTAGRTSDVWVYDLRTEGTTRITFEGGSAPVWKPEGDAITFSASPFVGTGPDRHGLHTQPIDGRSGAERLLPVEEWHRPIGWTPDGSLLAFEHIEADARRSIWVLDDGDTRRVVEDGYAGRLSPNGRWLAYHLEGADRAEVYVTPFPEADARWQISAGGGSGPAWSPDGTEVYYHSADRLIAASIQIDAGLTVTSRRVALEPFAPSWPDDYDIHPNGRDLVLFRPSAEPRDGEIRIVVDWAAELDRMREF